MPSPQKEGRNFEQELSQELGLEPVPNSGAVWHSKLDISGQGARWSLKYTTAKRFTIDHGFLQEAITACEGTGSDGSIPLWALRIEGEPDLVMMRKEDFKRMQEGDIQLLPPREKGSDVRRARSRVPTLFREE